MCRLTHSGLLGSHTSGHVDLSLVDGAQAFAEMTASKAALEELIGAEVVSFAYPYCRYSPACPEAARRAGYTSAVTCAGRGRWDPYELRRESVDSLDGRLLLALKSRGLFWPLRDSYPGQAVRVLARPLRHRKDGAGDNLADAARARSRNGPAGPRRPRRVFPEPAIDE